MKTVFTSTMMDLLQITIMGIKKKVIKSEGNCLSLFDYSVIRSINGKPSILETDGEVIRLSTAVAYQVIRLTFK